ncbi:hypothetical protein ACFL0C_00845 [Patescibacteria group bacterium]
MATLLMHLVGSRMYNFTLFRPHLILYDNHITYKKRHILTHDEFSVTYNHISQINIIRFIYLYAHIEIVTTAPRVVLVKWIPKGKAKKAKDIIDHKVYLANKRHARDQNEQSVFVEDFELSLRRLNELVNTGKISKREFNHRRKQLLKKHY